MEPTIKLDDQSILSGTSLFGEIVPPYANVVKLLGKPNGATDGYKIDAKWLITIDGIPFSIYNYKDGKNYNGSGGIATTKLTDWHIGASHPRDARMEEAASFLAKKLGSTFQKI